MDKMLRDEFLAKVAGGIADGDMYVIGKFTCPYCGKTHQVRFTVNITTASGNVLEEALPCGSDRFINGVFYASQSKCVYLQKKGGSVMVVPFTQIGGGIYGEKEFFF